MEFSELEWQQRKCQHTYGPWEHSEEIRNERDVYKRVCMLCMNVDTHIGRMPPEGYKEPIVAAVITSQDEVFKNKMSFLIQLASSIVRQRPGLPVCYIAGKVTGLNENLVYRKFYKQKIALEAKGFIVLNPCDFISINENWKVAMRMATTLLMMADHIYMLPCWQDSPGAKIEFEMAAKFGITTITE